LRRRSSGRLAFARACARSSSSLLLALAPAERALVG
jgi:hypothetical protein